MNEWGVVGVIVVLVTLIIGIGTPILKLNGTISRLDARLENFESALFELQSNSRQNHEKIWTRLDEHSESISEIKTEVEILKRN